jgi:hypothetical protein
MRTSPFSFHELHINNTKTIQKPENFSKIKTSILTTLYSYHNFVPKMKVSLKVTNISLYTNQKESTQETS